jgi:hypothetical protein
VSAQPTDLSTDTNSEFMMKFDGDQVNSWQMGQMNILQQWTDYSHVIRHCNVLSLSNAEKRKWLIPPVMLELMRAACQ